MLVCSNPCIQALGFSGTPIYEGWIVSQMLRWVLVLPSQTVPLRYSVVFRRHQPISEATKSWSGFMTWLTRILLELNTKAPVAVEIQPARLGFHFASGQRRTVARVFVFSTSLTTVLANQKYTVDCRTTHSSMYTIGGADSELTKEPCHPPASGSCPLQVSCDRRSDTGQV